MSPPLVKRLWICYDNKEFRRDKNNFRLHNMPIIKSAKKALRQNQRRNKRNIARKQRIKKVFKEIQKLVIEKKQKEAKALLSNFYKVLDKAVKTGLMKKNTAGRRKSRITQLINKLKKPSK